MFTTEKARLSAGFREAFGAEPQRFFAAPGRTEIGGNHTDHQRGRVLAAAVDLHTCAAVAENGEHKIRVQSQGYPLCQVDLADLTPKAAEYGTTTALIRGVAAKFAELGCPLAGVDLYVTSTVLPGSGLSSSAAFEVLMGTVLNGMFFHGKLDAKTIAGIGQYAENVFFGKPCGLMDQMASAVGNLVTIDFFHRDAPDVRPVAVDFASFGHALCILDTGADHADLTEEYAAITQELKAVCQHFGKEVLTEIAEDAFFAAIPALRQACGDRAVLRAIHFYEENARVPQQVAALEEGDFARFLALVQESGQSSWTQLQNVIPAGRTAHQEVALSLSLCRKFLQGRGACRVHGGGFAGTIQAFVPLDLLEDFCRQMESVLGKNACHVLSICPTGGMEMA